MRGVVADTCLDLPPVRGWAHARAPLETPSEGLGACMAQ